MLKKFMSYYKPHMRLFIADMICAFFIAVIGLAFPFLVKEIINVYIPAGNWQMLIILCAVLLAIYIVKAFLNFFVQYKGHVMGVRIQGDMRRDIFHHLQRMPFSFFDENKTGSIMSRIINDLFEIAELSHHGPEDLFLSVITLGGALTLICFINPFLALITLGIVPFMLWFAIAQRMRMKTSFAEMRKETGEINSSVESAVSGIRVSRAYTATNHELQKFDNSNNRFKIARGKAFKVMGVFGSGMGLFTDIMYLVALVSGGLFRINDWIDDGGFAAYILYISSVISPIRTLTSIFESIQGGISGFARFNEIMVKEPEAEDPNAIETDKVEGAIEFNNVTFHYANMEGDRTVLKEVSFKLDSGKTVALVGPSGGGKTTMCHLIPRFYEVDSGSITIDGIDIRNYSRMSLRKNIGIVQQDVFLFGGTIRENIAYGNLEASEEEIFEAAKKANIHDYIMTLPDTYETETGERGVKLSGGQKQRISIARAFLKNPPILILDEATSALDNVTEMLIQQSLNKLSEGRTTIIVAHRLSTIKNADEILVVTQKGIEERGSHKQLLAKQNGVYAELYNNQFKLDNGESV